MKDKVTANIFSKVNSLTFALMLTVPSLGYGSVEEILNRVQSRVVTTFIPLVGILGLMYAGMSYIAGHPNARNRLVWAIVGAFIGFAAPAIIQLIQQLAH